MGSKSDQAPLVAIVGETSSGKSALALDLARQFGGEIIAADSRTIYRELSIGTAKPTPNDLVAVRHHLINVVDPDEQFSVAMFKRSAQKAMSEIYARGHLPLLVGGSGLYADSILFDFTFQAKPDPEVREKLQNMSIDQLQKELITRGIPLPFNERNPRHLIRAIETRGKSGSSRRLRTNTLVIGLRLDREELESRVVLRVDRMLRDGFIQELEGVVSHYGWEVPALQAPGYKAFRKYLEGKMTFDEARQILIHDHLQLAKRQRTWFRRNKSIHWISKKEDAVELVTTLLNKSSID